MRLIDIYSYLLANWLDGGAQVRRGKMQATDIVPDYNVIFTKSSVKKVYHLTGLRPSNTNLAFIDFLRERMFELNPDVELIITVHNYPTHVDVNSEKFNRQMSRANEAYSSYKEAYDSQSGLARLTGKTYRLPGGGRLRLSKERLDDLYQAFISYYYLYNFISAGGTVSLTEIFFEICGEDLRAVKRAGQDLQGLLGPLYVGCVELKSLNKTYLSEFGPAMPMRSKLHKKFLPQLLFTDEDSTAWTSFKGRGLVGGKGILLGMDFRSRLPLSVPIFGSGSAQIWLYAGKTGSGKTYSATQMILSALARPDCAASVIDIKGNEWTSLAKFVETKIISFDGQNKSFVNTLRLDDMVDVAIGENAQYIYDTAVSGTVQLLSLIIDLKDHEGSRSDLNLILNETVNKLYSMRRVSPDNPASFKNTAGMKYAELLPIMESLLSTVTYTPEQKKMLGLARSRCHAYIGASGLFGSEFTNEVTLSDVLHSKLVVFSLNKNQNAMYSDLDVLRVFMIQFLDTKKQTMLKQRGMFQFCVYEELQRVEAFGDLLVFLAHQVTGARSNNAVIVLLLNSLRILNTEKARDVRSNITSLVCGLMEDNDIRDLRDNWGKDWLASQLELISRRPQIFRNCFAVDADLGTENIQTMFKVEFPREISLQFRTRTILEE